MPRDEHVAALRHGAAAWNAWRAENPETPDLSRAGIRGFDLSGFDLSRVDLRGADLRGTNLTGANLSGARLEGANLFKAVLDGADFAGAFLNGAQFLSCAQLVVTRGWHSLCGMTRLPVAPLFPIEKVLRAAPVDLVDEVDQSPGRLYEEVTY
jgi:hypothetical protein